METCGIERGTAEVDRKLDTSLIVSILTFTVSLLMLIYHYAPAQVLQWKILNPGVAHKANDQQRHHHIVFNLT